MPWKGDGFPSLGAQVGAWIETSCVIPDGEQTGMPYRLTREMWGFLDDFYRLNPKTGEFTYRRGQLVRPQKWGKGPFSAAIICAEAGGPVLFDGWDAGGKPVGKPWPTPWIQVVAVSEDQTDNVWTALLPMIELGSLAGDIPDTGKTRINIEGAYGSQGVIEPVTSAAISRLGQRITFAVHDETGYWTGHNGGVKLADTQRRNLAGMGGRSIETTNAWDPSEESVAQSTYESGLRDVLVDFPPSPKGSIRNKQARRKVLNRVYGDSWWVDKDRIEAEIEELLPRDPNQAERFFLNRVIAGQDKAFDVEAFAKLDDGEEIGPNRIVTVGFDGSKRQDATGLVVTDVERGHQIVAGFWERPRDLHAEADWEIPVDEVVEAVEYIFERWDVFLFYGDPPYWTTEMGEWAGRFGTEKVVEYWTNHLKRMAYSIRAWLTDWTSGNLSHDGNEHLVEHVGNAIKRGTKMRDPDDESFLWVIRKDGAKSPRKIDLTMAAILSWQARIDAIEKGALNQPVYGHASWSDGGGSSRPKVKKADYIPCTSCQKPIHPNRHGDDIPANERGRCLKCRLSEGS